MKREDALELMEEIEEYQSKYGIACLESAYFKNGEDGFYFCGNMMEELNVYAGHFDSHVVAADFIKGELSFDGVDREGIWKIKILFKYYQGDHQEPSYFEILLTDAQYLGSFIDYLSHCNKIDGMPVFEVNRPPLGIMPEWRHKELRREELGKAIKRYIKSDLDFPEEWMIEYGELCTWLNKNSPTLDIHQKIK